MNYVQMQKEYDKMILYMHINFSVTKWMIVKIDGAWIGFTEN